MPGGKMDGGAMGKGKMDGGAMDKGKMDGGAMGKGKMDAGAMEKGKMDSRRHGQGQDGRPFELTDERPALTPNRGAPLRLVIRIEYGIKSLKQIGTIRLRRSTPGLRGGTRL